MSVDPDKALTENILEEQYYEDVTRKTIKFFEELNLSLNDLLDLQKKQPIIYPWDDKYNTARLGFNKIGQYFPKFIVMVSIKKDVKWALQFTKKYNIPFTIKGGGHDSLCYSLCNGIIIDMSNRNYIDVNLDTNTVKIGAGVRIGCLVEILNKNKLFISMGSCFNVGITGLTQGAGCGYLRRKYGLTIDHLLDITIVLSEGKIVKCSKNDYSDLFWALSGGGGGSFGVITDLTFKAHKAEKMVIFSVWIPFKHFTNAFDIWQKWSFEATKNLTSYIQLYSPNDNKREEAILVAGQFTGKKFELLKLLEIFGDLPSKKILHYKDLLETECECCIRYPEYFYKYLNLFALEYLPRKTIHGLKKILKASPSYCRIEIDGMGGVISEMKSTDTAFPWRNSKFWLVCRSATDNQEDIPFMNKWVHSTYNYLLENGMSNIKTGLAMSYVNFKNPELTKEEYPLVYWSENAKKLSKIKRKYDPDDIFHFAQSVPLKL